jgi:hypothetical protein
VNAGAPVLLPWADAVQAVLARPDAGDGEEPMEPRIDRTQFGSVTIDGEVFTHDVIIGAGGREGRSNQVSAQGSAEVS